MFYVINPGMVSHDFECWTLRLQLSNVCLGVRNGLFSVMLSRDVYVHEPQEKHTQQWLRKHQTSESARRKHASLVFNMLNHSSTHTHDQAPDLHTASEHTDLTRALTRSLRCFCSPAAAAAAGFWGLYCGLTDPRQSHSIGVFPLGFSSTERSVQVHGPFLQHTHTHTALQHSCFYWLMCETALIFWFHTVKVEGDQTPKWQNAAWISYQ